MTSYKNIMEKIEEGYEKAGKEVYGNVNMVDSPPHYNNTEIECIEAIAAATGDGFEYYLQGNIMKYLWRYRYKNGVEDLEKARWYLNKLIVEVEGLYDDKS
jgi:hypothetical protein